MDKLIWVQTTWDTEEPRTRVTWPALKYPTLDDLLKTDTLVRDNALLKKKILASNHHKRVLGYPIARLLGPPPGQVVVEWLTPSNYNGKAFFDDFVALSRQFISLPETSKVRSQFDQALKDAFSSIESFIEKSSVEKSHVDAVASPYLQSDLQSICKVLHFDATSMTSSITCHGSVIEGTGRLVHESPYAAKITNNAIVGVNETTPIKLPAVVKKKNLNHRRRPHSEETFKYEEVVRKKADRRSFYGHTCQECDAFANYMLQQRDSKGVAIFSRKDIVQECSRHRKRSRQDKCTTPEGFWELSFADSIEKRMKVQDS